MAVIGIKGYGTLTIGTETSIGQQRLSMPRFNEFTFSLESESTDIQAFVNGGSGRLATVDTLIGAESATVQIVVPSFDWETLQLLSGQEASSSSSFSIDIPGAGEFVTNGTNAQIASVTNLTTGVTTASVSVTINTRGTWGEARPLTVISSSASLSSANQVAINTSTNTFYTSLSNVGAPIDYRIRIATDCETIGVVTSPYLLQTVGLFGKLAFPTARAGAQSGNSGIYLDIPRMTRVPGFELAIGAETSTTLEYNVEISGSNASLYRFIRIA